MTLLLRGNWKISEREFHSDDTVVLQRCPNRT